MKYILVSAASLIILWTVLTIVGTLNGWGREPLASQEDFSGFMLAAKEKIHSNFVGNIAMALIKEGEVYEEYCYSYGDSINRNTRFQVASLSKWITAYGVMVLVEKGKLELDKPVSEYLNRWALPPSKFDNNQVTVRKLLSHTAGLVDGLGYGGFVHSDSTQSLVSSLTQARDASPDALGIVKVGLEPGSQWEYSGGGYTLLQLLIEEVTGSSFEAYMQENVFEPIGMANSTYILDHSSGSLATSYSPDSTKSFYYYFTSLAATSLYTSLADMEKFLQAQLILNTRNLNNEQIVKPKTIQQMRQPLGHSMGAAIWGLGTMLYAPNGDNDFIIGHDGKNEPAINTTVRINPSNGNGIIILETGHPILATELAGDWVFWETGNVDFLIFTMTIESMVKVIFIGWFIIIALSAMWWMFQRKRIRRIRV